MVSIGELESVTRTVKQEGNLEDEMEKSQSLFHLATFVFLATK